jgi:glucosamine--fructose-6-phosphate aminotransferase (isomerizing)
MLRTGSRPGTHTEAEILSEPRCWDECLRALRENSEVDQFLQVTSSRRDWMFVGCGSSYYLAQAAASSWTALTGLAARAIPASEVLLFPNLIPGGVAGSQAVLISRSGHTSEILKAAEYLKSKGAPGVAITCSPGQPIQALASATVCLAPADEKSMVMTRSFTSMLIAMQFLAAKLRKNTGFVESLEGLARSAQKALDLMVPRIRAFVEGHDFADYVYLGQGPYYGLACEAALKVTEMSCSYAQSFHTLEFRHGPKSIVGPETLIGFLLSQFGQSAEVDLLEEVKRLGGTTLVVVNKADATIRKSSDLLIELNMANHSDDTSEYARLAAHILPGQLLGLYAGLGKGLDPDQPRNLSRAVILNESQHG